MGSLRLSSRDISRIPRIRRLRRLWEIPRRRTRNAQVSSSNPLGVRENLELGAFVPHARTRRPESLEDVLAQFPILRERHQQRAGTLSGGEQQMLAMARALMLRPSLLILDEPSLGLAPKVQAQVFEVIKSIHARGTAVLLVEQNVQRALAIAERGHVLETGRVVLSGASTDLIRNEKVRSAYIGL